MVKLGKLAISASRYAERARIASYLVKLGASDEEFCQLVSGIYDSCKKMDLQPDEVVYLLKLLIFQSLFFRKSFKSIWSNRRVRYRGQKRR
jgi:hypothetical protein